MTNELKIKISAELDDLKKGLDQADDAVDKFASTTEKSSTSAAAAMNAVSNSAAKMTNAISQSKSEIESWDEAARRNTLEQYDAGLRKVETRADGTTGKLKILNRELKLIDQNAMKFSFGVGANPQLLPKTTNDFNNLTKGIRGTNTVAIEFSRIIQDAPYGIIGVGNNITQLTQSFANLRAQTGSNSQALKLAFSSLLSGTNLLVLGISAVTTALTLYSNWSRKAKKDTEDLDDGTKRYIDTLEGVARAQADGAVNAQKDLAQLRLLYSATQNQTLAMDDRRKAAEELIKQYPKQFKGLTTEKILAGESADAYDRLSKSLVATARAAAVYSRVADNQAKILDKQLRLADLTAERARLQSQRDAQLAAATAAQQRATGLASGSIESGLARRAQKQLEETNKRILENQLEIGKITTENNDLQEYYNKLISEGADLSGRLGTSLEKSGKKTKDASDKLAEALIENENRVQTSVRQGRDKELEQARIKYEELYKMAKNNSEAIIQITRQEADEIDAINRKYDSQEENARVEGESRVQARRRKLIENGLKIAGKLREEDRKAREKAEKDLAKRIYETQLYYSTQLGNAVGNALEDALGRGENFFKALRDEFKRTLIRMAADAAAAQIGKALMNGINKSGSSSGGGFWNFLSSAIGWAGKLFSGSNSYSSGSFSTGNYGGGNFPSTSPVKGGGFVPGIQSTAPTGSSNSVSKLRGTDIYMANVRTIRLNDRFNGGQ